MSIKVASLYAEISADSSKLHTALTGAKSGLTSLKSDITSAMSVVGAITGAFVAAGVDVKKLADEYVAYADQVRAVTRLTGMQAEEASRLIQAADDMFISQQTLTSGLEFAIRQGYKPSTEWLGKMADQVMAMPAGANRAAAAIKLFGRQAGPEMLKMMEQGSTGINQMMAAIESGLIVTDQGILAALEYKKAMDGWTDTASSLKYELAAGLLPALTDIVDFIVNKSIPGWREFAKFIGLAYEKSLLFRGIVSFLTFGLVDFGVGADTAATSLDENLTPAIEDSFIAAEKLQAALIDKTAWEVLLTNAKDATSGAEDVIMGLGRDLQNFSLLGAEVWDGFLEATGRISPEAIAQFVHIQDAFLTAKSMLAPGMETTVVINFLVNSLMGGAFNRFAAPEIGGGGKLKLAPWATQADKDYANAHPELYDVPPGGYASGGSFSGWGQVGDAPGGGRTPYTEWVYAPHGATVYNQSQMSGKSAPPMASGGAIPPMGGEDLLDEMRALRGDMRRMITEMKTGLKEAVAMVV